MEPLQEQVDALKCNAFIGVAHIVEDKDDTLAHHILEDEERMQPISELVDELQENNDSAELFIQLEAKGITNVVLIRGW